MDWTALTKDPCDAAVQQKMHAFLQGIRRIEKAGYEAWLLDTVRGASCLDIGAVEHDLSYTEQPSWKHRMLTEVCSSVTGVDILEEPVKVLNSRGYDIRLCDATSDEDLGSRYDVVILGDVMEHVENPVKLLKFASRHLKEGGRIIAKTPNPWYIDNFIKVMKNRPFVNFEHIAWYTPTMALEIARRSGTKLETYIVFPRKRPWSTIFPNTDVFTRDFVYIFGQEDS